MISPASHYWGIDQSVTYGDATPILSFTSGIVDTGTTLLMLATDAFQAYQKATGGVPDAPTGLLKLTQAQYSSLKPLNFHVGGATYTLPANGQIFPRSLNTLFGGTDGAVYLIAGDVSDFSVLV